MRWLVDFTSLHVQIVGTANCVSNVRKHKYGWIEILIGKCTNDMERCITLSNKSIMTIKYDTAFTHFVPTLVVHLKYNNYCKSDKWYSFWKFEVGLDFPGFVLGYFNLRPNFFFFFFFLFSEKSSYNSSATWPVFQRMPDLSFTN